MKKRSDTVINVGVGEREVTKALKVNFLNLSSAVGTDETFLSPSQ